MLGRPPIGGRTRLLGLTHETLEFSPACPGCGATARGLRLCLRSGAVMIRAIKAAW
jgi:hypothetical protein